MTQLSTKDAIVRFSENENRVDIFVNDPQDAGFYTTNEATPRQVESLPALMERLKNRYLTVVARGDWATTTIYSLNDAVEEAGLVYLCTTPHTSGTFATDLAAGKWVLFQALESALHKFFQSNGVERQMQEKARESITFDDFGGIGNGTADDTTAVIDGIAEANLRNLPIDLQGKNYKVNPASVSGGILILPIKGFSAGGRISGIPCKWEQIKRVTTTGEFQCDELTLNSVWTSEFQKLVVDGDLILQSSSPVWGEFWNTFGTIECEKLIIDVDQGQSVNQNLFFTTRASGGVHIRGVATTGVREAHNNLFICLDTTGANLTAVDGTTGHHLLNDSVLNQTNTVISWYAEGTGARTVKGNWHIINSNVDAGGGIVCISERNHYLASALHGGRNNGDFFAGGCENLFIGGEWDILNSSWEAPYSLSTFGVMTNTTPPLDVSLCPSQIPFLLTRETATTFSGYQLNFDFDTPQQITVAIWYSGDDFTTVESDGGSFTTAAVFTHADGWKLARFTLGGVSSWIKLYLNAGSASYKRISINGIFATNTKTAMLPVKSSKRRKVRGEGTLSAGGTFVISLPTGGYASQMMGRCSITAIGNGSSPTFIGVSGAIECTFSKTRYDNIDNATVLSSVNKAIGQINTTGKDITVTGTTAGIQLALPAGIQPCEIKYEIEVFE